MRNNVNRNTIVLLYAVLYDCILQEICIGQLQDHIIYTGEHRLAFGMMGSPINFELRPH